MSPAPAPAAAPELGTGTRPWFITQPCSSLGGSWGSLNRGTCGGGTSEAAAGLASEQGKLFVTLKEQRKRINLTL